MEIEEYLSATDQQLVEYALKGDTSALEYLFGRYSQAVLKLHIQRTGNREDADDMLQETLIKAYLNLHRYNDAYTFGQWIFVIARNTFIDYSRRKRDDLSIDYVSKNSTSISAISTHPSPEESMIRSQQRVEFSSCLKKMKPQYAELIDLRFVKELSYEEIAKKKSLPLGTVKTQIHRAREQMIKLIKLN